jgi:GNAT superfamily N-acetyltransferase
MEIPKAAALPGVLESLAFWQQDGAPFQLHPGDIGWHWRLGADATALATRVWAVAGEIVAVGLVDGPTLRLALPSDGSGDALVDSIVADIEATDLASVEAPRGSAIRSRLAEHGWTQGELWTPLVRDLSDPIDVEGLTVTVTDRLTVDPRVSVHRAAFHGSAFSAELWRAMASGPAYGSARCVVGWDRSGTPVAGATVWSAGRGRPGLLEPLGVPPEHRGHGYGTAIALAAAAALRDLGASTALVGTPSSNTAGVATYVAAGFVPGSQMPDLARPRP